MLDPRRPFTRPDALAAGFTPKQLRGSKFRRIFHGVYVDAKVPDHPLIRAKGALLVHPSSAMVSHHTAALVYELPLRRDVVEHVTVVKPADRSARAGITCHVGPTDSARLVDGVRVPSPADLFSQLASVLSLVDLVVVGDAMVRRKLTSPEALVEHAMAAMGRHRVLARRAAALVRERVDSPMETRLRVLLVLAGLPEPEVNLSLRDSQGRELRRLDLSYPLVKLAVEYDGRHHIERKSQWSQDLERREELDEEGWRILVVTSDGIYRQPERTVLRVWRALRDRGFAGVPARPGDEWRGHFAS
ncbi:MAG TPA: DUF559 domain-containing protein [Nocardioidaceae bacterium]|nr:DUF559 domain-containing protein [Nocardioidaceae bacterium]